MISVDFPGVFTVNMSGFPGANTDDRSEHR